MVINKSFTVLWNLFHFYRWSVLGSLYAQYIHMYDIKWRPHGCKIFCLSMISFLKKTSRQNKITYSIEFDFRKNKIFFLLTSFVSLPHCNSLIHVVTCSVGWISYRVFFREQAFHFQCSVTPVVMSICTCAVLFRKNRRMC